MRGVVVEFDEARGLGRVSLDGGETLGFHCLSLSDGSRTIAVGARVRVGRAVGRLGRDEAIDITVEP
ncbi:MAG TPA: hypothetical protein VGS61_08350 [Acidimicrobiales bacterium]|nr:hypothetical protein [Acidimicrobiales bacterium]